MTETMTDPLLLTARVRELEAEVARLRGAPTPAPAWPAIPDAVARLTRLSEGAGIIGVYPACPALWDNDQLRADLRALLAAHARAGADAAERDAYCAAMRRQTERAVQYATLLIESNDLMRSCYAVAERERENPDTTNWSALRDRLHDALERQHAVTNAIRAARAATPEVPDAR